MSTEDRTNTKVKLRSYGFQCVAMHCVSRQYMFKDNIRMPTNISFFRFPKNNVDINVWCNLIKRQNNRDNFSVTPSHRVCGKHFEENFLFKAPGGTRTRLLQGAKPVLYIWNEFCKTKQRKAPKVRDSKRLDNDHLDKEDFCNNAEAPEEEPITEVEIVDITDIPSENVISNLKNENEKLKTQLEHALNQKLASSKLPIVSQIESSDELCNHYTGFTTQERLNIIYDFLNPGIDGENIILLIIRTNIIRVKVAEVEHFHHITAFLSLLYV